MFRLLLVILGLAILFYGALRVISTFLSFPAPAFFGPLFDSRFRKLFQSLDKTVERSGIKKRTKVLEVGCGSGTFTTVAARKVGKGGKIYALDIQKKMLAHLERKLKRKENKDIDNVELIEGDACQLPFDNNSFDLVFMVSALQEIDDKNKALKEAKRVLRAGGTLAVTEMLFDPDYPFKSTTIKMGQEAGFVVDRVLGNFWDYTVRFKRP